VLAVNDLSVGVKNGKEIGITFYTVVKDAKPKRKSLSLAKK